MKRTKKTKPEALSIFVPDMSERILLKDYRGTRRYGNMSFGTIEQVAKNYGVKMKKSGDGLIFTAPKGRLQMFAEKLHFAMVKFRPVR